MCEQSSMTKIRVLYEDGEFRGGLLDLDSHNWRTCRTWPGRPRRGCSESMMDTSTFKRSIYEGCWMLIRMAEEPDIQCAAPDGTDGVDVAAHALQVSERSALAWFRDQGITAPEDLVEWVRQRSPELEAEPSEGTADAGEPLTTAQLEVWGLLKGRAMTAKELSAELPGAPGEDAVRKRVESIKRTGRDVASRPGRGYYRPDAPPDDLAAA